MLDACKKVIDCFIRTVYWIPVLFVLAVIVWGYVVYVYVMNISDPFPEEDKVPPSVKVLRLIGAHIILTLHLSSFLRAIFTNHKEVPVQYHVTDEQLERLEEMVDGQPLLQEIASGLPISTMTRSGSVRYCDRCEVVKPDRCHHCSICDRCVLKMDHHCPWVNNCVGYSNYKYFVLFLFYTVVTSLYVCLTGLYDFTQAWNGTLDDNRAAKFNIIFCFFVSAMFGFSTSFLFFFHIYLVLVNKTTLENMKSPIVAGGPDRRYFNIGFKRNIQAVFGKNCLLAFLPIDTSEGDGLSFSHRHGSRGGLEVGDRTSPPGDGGQAVRNLDGDGGDQTTSGEESEIEIFAADTTAETQPLTQRTTEL